MADLYLSRKLAVASSPVSGSGAPHWFLNSPTIGSKISRTISRGSVETTQEENDVEELEMLLEVMKSYTCHSSYLTFQIWVGRWVSFAGLLYANWWDIEQVEHGKHHAHEILFLLLDYK